MRLGANGFPAKDPEQWIRRVLEMKATAVAAPVSCLSPKEEIAEYQKLIQKHDLLVGEVGIWRNSLALDPAERNAALEFSKGQLALAEELGANCCVNISGARGPIWNEYYPENYSADTYALLVDTVREIIDSVNPKRTFYTLEPMQWMHPDSPDGYLKLLQDIDRPAAAVHLDYANMINSFDRYRHRDEFVKECFRKLGPYVKSIHAKDVHLGPESPCCLTEGAPGTGEINFGLVLQLSHKLGADTPVFVEHLTSYEAYRDAVAHLRTIAEQQGIPVR